MGGLHQGTPPEVGVVIPCFNDASTVRDVISDVLAHTPGAHVVVVDDGSVPSIQLERDHRVTLIRHSSNQGLAAAFRTGLRYCQRQRIPICVKIDADGDMDSASLGKLIGPIRDGSADVVVSTFDPSKTPSAIVRDDFVFRHVYGLLTGWVPPTIVADFRAFGARSMDTLLGSNTEGWALPLDICLLKRRKIQVVRGLLGHSGNRPFPLRGMLQLRLGLIRHAYRDNPRRTLLVAPIAGVTLLAHMVFNLALFPEHNAVVRRVETRFLHPNGRRVADAD